MLNHMLSVRYWIAFTLVAACTVMSAAAQAPKPSDKPQPSKQDGKQQTASDDGLTLVGTIGASITSQWSSGVFNSSPFSIFGYANMIFGYKDLSVPVYFNYTNVASTGVFKDPKSAFGLPTYIYGATPMYRKWKGHLGYSNLSFNPYVFKGMQFLGAGLEYNARFAHFAVFGGWLNLETQVNPKSAIQNYSDSLLGLNVKSSKLPQFKRNVVGANLGTGNKRNYFELSFVKVQDDLASLADTVEYKGKKWHRDSLVKAKENFVMGMAMQMYISKYFYIFGNAAASVYTADRLSKEVDLHDMVEGMDSWTRKGLDLVDRAKPIMALRSSTSLHTASDAGFGIVTKPYRGKFSYRRIDPGYTSLGTTLAVQNVQNLSASGNIRLFKGHSILSYSANGQRDNLSKKQKYTNQIAVFNAHWINRIDDFSLMLAYNGIKQDQFDGTAVVNDSTRIDQLTHSLMVQPSYVFGENGDNTVNLNFSLVESSNLNELLPGLNDVKTTSFGAGYNYAWGKRQNQAGVTLDYSMSNSSYSDYNSLTFGAQYSGSLVETQLSKLTLTGKASLGYNKVQEMGDASKIYSPMEVWYGYEKASYQVIDVTEYSYNLSLSLRYQHKTGHIAALTTSLCNFSNREVIGQNVSTTMTLKVVASYSYSFGRHLFNKEK